MKTKAISEEAALSQLAALCSSAEHCSYELREKMRRWELSGDAQERILERLSRERYFDDERYARAFAHDKVRYNKWGRRKVEQALWMKRIDEHIVRQALDEIEDDVYLEVLRPLLQQKRKSTKAANEYEMRQRLVRFALQRGFDMRVIKQCMQVNEEDIQCMQVDDEDLLAD